ncbi:MAG: hypothetical protein ACI85F_000052 [Bacteroidia bacterium]|jgi:hypothetical protein
MDNTSTYPFSDNNFEPLATQGFDLNEECETLHMVEDALRNLKFTPDSSVVNRALAYSKSYNHAESKIIGDGIGLTLN